MTIRITAIWMMVQLLFGSIALPLGDFSLIKELPRMYQAYEKVVEPDEKGLFDFIGDYLLDGKDLLGHNQHDQPSKPGALQFQSSPCFAVIIPSPTAISVLLSLHVGPKLAGHHILSALSDYHPTFFRPPLA